MFGTSKNAFQIVLLSVFGFFALLGLILFATYSSKNKAQDIGRVVIWGTIDQQVMNKFLSELRYDDQRYKNVLYAYYPKDRFFDKVIDALAAGEGPDIIILNQEQLLRFKNKIYPVSYDSFSKRQFKDTFIDGAEIFLAPEGILAIPFAVDPMIMYWNRDIFADKGLVEPPKLWKELPKIVPQIVERDKVNNILLAAVPFGAYENVNHAKAILATLFMQIGSNVVSYNPDTGDIDVGIEGSGARGAKKALRFYTSFANPVSNVYSWNRSLDNSLDLFTQDSLAMYFGFASDLPVILSKNPHLNFDAALVPQVDKSDTDKKTRVYGKFWAFAITKASQNKAGAYQFVLEMLQSKYSKQLSEALQIANVQRRILAEKPDDPLLAIFRDAAVISHSFLDPDPKTTDKALAEAVNLVISGQSDPGTALARSAARIRKALENFVNK